MIDVKLTATAPLEAKVGLVAIPLFEGDFEKKATAPLLDASDEALGGVVRQAAKQEGFSGKANQKLVIHTHGKIPAPYLVLVGLGKRDAFQAEALRAAAGALAKEARRTKSAKIALALPEGMDVAEEVRAAAEGLSMGSYRFDRWKSQDEEEKKFQLTNASFHAASLKGNSAAKKTLALGLAVGEAVAFARDLVNEPGGTMTPTALANAASQMAKDAGLQVTVHEKKKIEQLKMGMFLGVAQGSQEAPKLIEIKYVPKGAGAKAKPLALVGKAITFDSGGLSLKPADAMVDMKTDMAGSAAVFGAMKVIAEVIQPNFPITAYVGSCENMPSGTAYRPGDILTARNGKTVEITNTDAEGRLVLGDVLAYACESKPRGVIDLATLTGACMVALGMYTVGTFGADDELVEEVLGAAKAAGEDFWRLPLVPEVKENLKSDVADMKNSGTRWGGAISGAQFLQEFVGDTPWVHLDIAGPSTTDKDRGYFTKGGTGVGVRTLVELVRNMKA
jgi:leucyl aminopeptidase